MSESRDPASAPAGAQPPERLVGARYRLGPVIGRGGMATIHRATDTRTDREVAIKLLRPEIVADPDLAQRFRREALAATVLRHPNIVACLDTGTDGDQPFLVMELVDGEDLAARLRRGGRLAPGSAARIALDVARGLGVAHVRGIVHRDVKPGNILLAGDGRAMVTDFGIARLARDAEAASPGTTLGSVQYFSPEQARGRTTTPASDVYGLGLVLFEACTGQRTWSGATNDALALARVGVPAPSARAIRPEIPLELDTVIRRALAPEPEDRFTNGAAMAAALEPIVAATPVVEVAAPRRATPPTATTSPPDLAPPVRPPSVVGPSGGATATAPPPAPAGARSVLPRPRPRRRAGRTVMLAGLGAMVVGIILVVMPIANGGTAAVDPTTPPDAAGTPVASAPPEATAPPASAEVPASASPAPDATPSPSRRPPSQAGDLCETYFDLPCSLSAGSYASSRFTPRFELTLGDGWSTVLHRPGIITLSRPEGSLTFLSGVRTIDPEGAAIEAPDRSRPFIETLVTVDGLAATQPARLRIDGRRGYSSDVSPTGDQRLALFATDDATFYVEPDRTTRVVAMTVRAQVVVIVIEPGDDADLSGILETADVAAGTIRWD